MDDLQAFRERLGNALGLPIAVTVGHDPRAVPACQRWLSSVGEAALLAECTRLAQERCKPGETPRSLSWFAGWLDTVTDRQLGAGMPPVPQKEGAP